MLDFNYSDHYAGVVQSIAWRIELPAGSDDFFQQNGVLLQTDKDYRGTQRRIVRVRGMMVVEKTLPAIERDPSWTGVYTKDFSKDGVGIVSPIQWFPEEQVRLILPSFWLQTKVERCRKINRNCYEVGLSLIRRCDPDRAAFIHDGRFLKASD